MANYAVDANVNTILGNLAGRLPAGLSPISEFLGLAHATVIDELSEVYPNGIPAFAGEGLLAVKWAEAKLAAAEVLSAVRVNLPAQLVDAPSRLKAEALATLRDGIVGYPAGSGGDPAHPTAAPAPRVSSFTQASAFVDPYDSLRDLGLSGL